MISTDEEVEVKTIRGKLKAYIEKLKQVKNRIEPELGELANISLEMEFEN